MRSKITALTLAGALFISPLALASDLSSSDSEFLFGSNKVTVTSLSDEEIRDIRGQQFGRSLAVTILTEANEEVNANLSVAIGAVTP